MEKFDVFRTYIEAGLIMKRIVIVHEDKNSVDFSDEDVPTPKGHAYMPDQGESYEESDDGPV